MRRTHTGPMWWEQVLAILAGILVVYAAALVLLYLYARRHPETISMRSAMRLLPDLLRLVRSLSVSSETPLSVREPEGPESLRAAYIRPNLARIRAKTP